MRDAKMLWLLNTQKGLAVLEELLANARDLIGLVSSYPEVNTLEDFGSKIEARCKGQNIPFVSWPVLRSDVTTILANHNISGIVAAGWQFIIDQNHWEKLPHKLIVFHDSLLPRYRGFAPLPTAMIKGDSRVGMSVIFAGDDTDNGEIILQKEMEIGLETYIADAIAGMSDLYQSAARDLTRMIRAGHVPSNPQDESRASYSIWRSPEDCRIEWSNSARSIYDLIRAVGHPYVGAFSTLEGQKMRIWSSSLLEGDINFELRDHGKIWRLDDGFPIVVCGAGLLKITSMADEQGTSKLPLTKLRLRFE